MYKADVTDFLHVTGDHMVPGTPGSHPASVDEALAVVHFRTKDGLTVTSPNSPGTRSTVFKILIDDMYHLSKAVV